MPDLPLSPDFLFTLFLLLIFPLRNIWRSLRRPPTRPVEPPLRSYWKQARPVLVMLAVFLAVVRMEGHSASELGLDIPLSAGGAWGLAAASILLLCGWAFARRTAARHDDTTIAKERAALKDLPFAMPRTPAETLAFLLVMTGMTALWEVLFRGYLLLVLTPVTGMPVAVALAAIAYGAGHGYQNPRQFFGSIAAALVFTIAYAVSGSLWWLIILHAAAPVAMLLAARSLDARAPLPQPEGT